MELINKTPHTISVQINGEIIEFAPTSPARLSTRTVVGSPIETSLGSIPTGTVQYGTVEGLPEPTEGVIYICSGLVASQVNRRDVVSPDTSPASVVRDEAGNIKAVRSFITYGS